VQTIRLDRDHTVVTLTKEGRNLLESRRLDEDSRERQAFDDGVQKPRELKHDAELYRACTEEAERLRDESANIHRIVLENDLKSEYQPPRHSVLASIGLLDWTRADLANLAK
jgi:hypothetical protein